VRILSTPQILTTDNQEAKIYVGKNVPFQTTATLPSATAGEIYNSYEYRDVGKTLKITPQISKDRMVRLTLISLESHLPGIGYRKPAHDAQAHHRDHGDRPWTATPWCSAG
jgi:general secretion pathway protein D